MIPFVGRAATIVGGLVSVYLFAFMLRLITSSAAGENEPPDWPDLSDLWDDVLRPMFLVVGTIALPLLPVSIYWIYWAANVREGDAGLEFAGDLTLLRLLAVLAGLYIPMALLSVAMEDHLRGLNPVRVLTSIGKVFVPYLLVCGVMVLVILGILSLDYLPRIRVVTPVLSSVVFLYLVMIEMRLIGLLYHAYRFRLNWYDEATDRRARPGPEAKP
jgi:hypothetical protein